MAAYQKHTNTAVYNILRHNNREAKNPYNVDIDTERTKLNYSLTPLEHGNNLVSNKAYYNKRLSEVYHYKRNDLITCDEWIITAPVDLPKDQEQLFFKKCYEFLNSKYNEENCIHCSVHYDEGVKNDQGQVIHGRPHMHYMYIPVVPYTGTKNYTEKVCNKELMTKSHLIQFHPQLQEFLTRAGLQRCNVNSGITGVNCSVKDLKAHTLREMIFEQSKNIESLKEENGRLKKEIAQLQEHQQQVKRHRFGEFEREDEYEF